MDSNRPQMDTKGLQTGPIRTSNDFHFTPIELTTNPNGSLKVLTIYPGLIPNGPSTDPSSNKPSMDLQRTLKRPMMYLY